MSLLSDLDILDARAFDNIKIEPFTMDAVQPSSVDLHLDRRFLSLNSTLNLGTKLDPSKDVSEMFEKIEVEQDHTYQLNPGAFCLASTYEKVSLDSAHAARFEGKSSLGRLGLLTHITAGFIDPGFSGHITLELSNVTPYPIILTPGMRIGQICFMRMDRLVETPYGSAFVGSHYQNQDGPVASRSFANFKMIDVYGSRGEQRL